MNTRRSFCVSIFAAVAAAAAAAVPMPAEFTEGEVIEVDAAHGTVVLKHGFIRNLGMDPMAMEFEAKNRSMLARLKKGDPVLFKAVYDGGRYVLVDLRPNPRRRSSK